MKASPNGERCAAELLTEFVENRVHVYAVLGDIGRHRARHGSGGAGRSGGDRVMTDASGRRVHVTPFTADELWQAAAGAVLAVGTLRHLQRKVCECASTVAMICLRLVFLLIFFFLRPPP